MKSYPTSPIKLNLAEKLKDKGYFHKFFRGRAQDEVASQIKELREMRGLKQKELAKLCKTHQSAISRLEQATYSRWSVNTLWGLAEALDARVRIIFEPMADVIKQYEMLEKEEYAQLAISAIFEGESKQVEPPPGLVEEPPQGANKEAQYSPPPQQLTGQPLLNEPQPVDAR